MMIIDFAALQEIERGWDVAIVGAGAAGISLAVSLGRRGKRVLLIEGGGTQVEDANQDLYRGSVANNPQHGPLHQYRKRVFGGTTTVWGGRCSPFDEIDFEPRQHIAGSGWPLTLEDLHPYYRQAHEFCDIGEYEYRTRQLLDDGDDLIPGLDSPDLLQDRIWRFSLPTDFGKKYFRFLRDSNDVTVVMQANVVHIQLDANGKRVRKLRLRVLEGGPDTLIEAGAYVLAAGGLESTRLLLASDDVQPEGIGNGHGLLGRYYGSHLTGDFGTVRFDPNVRVKWAYHMLRDGVYYKQQLRISEAKQRQLGLLNMRCILTHPPFGDPSHGNGVLSSAYFAKRFFAGRISPEYSKDLASNDTANMLAHMRNIIIDSPGLVAVGTDWVRRRSFAKRKLPSIALPGKSGAHTLHFDAEQSPCFDSRVKLGDDVDALGMRRLDVDWRFNPEDVDRLLAGYHMMGEELARSSVGVQVPGSEGLRDRLLSGLGVGSHHLGTTRMSETPRDGVVDRDCRVHGLDNLYVAGPSVFRTGSFANPLLTIVALALRLSDKLSAPRPERRRIRRVRRMAVRQAKKAAS